MGERAWTAELVCKRSGQWSVSTVKITEFSCRAIAINEGDMPTFSPFFTTTTLICIFPTMMKIGTRQKRVEEAQAERGCEDFYCFGLWSAMMW